jgi:hypothetical protein
LKKIALLAPLAGWTAEQFSTYWRETHGPVVSRSPGYEHYRTRYVQNHVVVAAGPIGERFSHGGVAEFWTPGGPELERAIAASEIYRSRIGPDEARFLNLAGTVAVAAEETVIIKGASNLKVMVFASRHPDVSGPDFAARHQQFMTDLIGRRPDIFTPVRGYSQNHVVDGSLRSIADERWGAQSFDSVDEYWFDGVADANAFFATKYLEAIAPAQDPIVKRGSVVSFIAEEITFFEDGRVVDPPRRTQAVSDPGYR